jgi:diaminopimelate epimerase
MPDPVRFRKYQAAGNDYLVVTLESFQRISRPETIRRICDRHLGIGSDGILVHDPNARSGRFAMRIFNPDGGEAERSGNGLRIYARYLRDLDLAGEDPMEVNTRGGMARCTVAPDGRTVTVEMGKALFDSEAIPVAGPRREVLEETITAGGESLTYSAVSVGNPHCVLFRKVISEEEAHRLGPLLERHPDFPNRVNVQFVRIDGPDRLRLQSWERGAGYTLSSGTSACAAAAVACRLGRCGKRVAVEMRGGTLEVEVDPEYGIRLTGPVAAVAEGTLAEELLIRE